MSVRIIRGHVIDALHTLGDQSVHLVVTSPPYWGMRAYGTEPQVWGGVAAHEHEWQTIPERRVRGQDAGASARVGNTLNQVCATTRRGGQSCECGAWRGELGAERSPGQYLDHLVGVFSEVRRALRDDGTLWANVGDVYASGSQGGPGDARRTMASSKQARHGRRDDDTEQANRGPGVGLPDKNLCMIPWRFALAMQEAGWYVRSVIAWAKADAMPESVTDRPTSAWEPIFVFSKRARYFWDVEGFRLPGGPLGFSPSQPESADGMVPGLPSGAQMRNFWLVSHEPSAGAHHAAFPTEIPRRAILVGTSEKGACSECGAPWRRVSVDRALRTPRPSSLASAKERRTVGWEPTCTCGAPRGLAPDDLESISTPTGERAGEDPSLYTGRAGLNRPRGPHEGTAPSTRYEQRQYAVQLRRAPQRAQMESEAGPAFEHYTRTDRSGARPVPPALLDAWIARGWLDRVSVPESRSSSPGPVVPCTVLDPFTGSGTTLLAADRLGRDAIGIELKGEYADLAERRVRGDAPLFVNVSMERTEID